MSRFNDAYSGTPPWDIGHPQREILRLEKAGDLRGSVLEVGCGTGENALYLAEGGHEVWGVDSAPAAIEKAKAKALQRGLTVTFREFDALRLDSLGRTFDTVIDVGLFHTFSDEEREMFTRSLGAVLGPGGDYFMLCFSDLQPSSLGPRRVTQAEIRDTFEKGWKVDYIREAAMETRLDGHEIKAWLAHVTRIHAILGRQRDVEG